MAEFVPVYYLPGQTATLDLTAANSRVIFQCQNQEGWTWQADVIAATWSSGAILTPQVSNNATKWYAIPSSFTMTAVGISDVFGVKGYRYVSLYVSTAGSGSSTIGEITGFGFSPQGVSSAGGLVRLGATRSSGIPGGVPSIGGGGGTSQSPGGGLGS